MALVALVVAPAAHAVEVVSYEDLAPILAERCVMCHSGEGAAAGLRVDSFAALLEGGLKGPVVKAGDPAGSELIRRLQGTSQPRMPMTGPPFLPDSQVEMFARWISGGLQPGGADATPEPLVAAPSRPAAGEPVTFAHVAPLFATRCAKCHTENGLMGPAPEGYRLTSYEAVLATVDRVRVVPGVPGASELLRRVRGQARPRMPLDGPPYLSDEEAQLLEDWIAQGARNSEGEPAAVPVGARVRLHGMLGAGWTLDGLPLGVGPGTRQDKGPAAGDDVEVRGRIGADGGVTVDRVRPRER